MLLRPLNHTLHLSPPRSSPLHLRRVRAKALANNLLALDGAKQHDTPITHALLVVVENMCDARLHTVDQDVVPAHQLRGAAARVLEALDERERGAFRVAQVVDGDGEVRVAQAQVDADGRVVDVVDGRIEFVDLDGVGEVG